MVFIHLPETSILTVAATPQIPESVITRYLKEKIQKDLML